MEKLDLYNAINSMLSMKTVRMLFLLALGGFYILAATEHSRVVNTSKARGDQSGYLWDAQQVYANWHGRTPPVLVGERNRMPVYAGYLALFYNPRLTDPEFFEIGKIWNIRLSLALLALLYAIFSWYLPPLLSANLTLVVGFGYFVFKAGYTQSELLFYFLLFCTFLVFCHLLVARRTTTALWLAIVAGALAALAHLTKASVLPLVTIFLVVYGVSEIAAFVRTRSVAAFLWRAAAAGLMVGCFLAVLYPYSSNNKRAFGRYFYNVNTTFYVWYDNWPQASVGTIKHGDGVGWPTMAPDELPGMRKYWRQHTGRQIVDRVVGGFRDMAERSYATYWYLKYVTLYAVLALALIAAHPRAFGELIRRHAALFAFMLVYAATYLLATAFYAPVSGTGTTRFILAHLAPFLFVLSCFFAREPFGGTRWTVGGVSVTTAHVHVLVFAMMAFDLSFRLWPRLMTTYGGF